MISLLQKVRDISPGTSGPSYSDSIHFKRRRHHVQGVAVALTAADFFRIVIHPETEQNTW